jgi:phosphopantetheinyl transferase
MPLIYQQQINAGTRVGLWHIQEEEDFFLATVPLQREITHWHKRLQHLAGRYLLTTLVPGFPHDLVRIADTRKPFLENEAWHFSLSHCGDFAAALVSDHQRTGVDIEKIAAKVAKVQHKFLRTDEFNLLNALSGTPDAPDEITLLTTCWSIKEALFKWMGTGAINFKTHLCIEQLVLHPGGGLAHCRIKKNGDIPLRVSFVYLEHNCLSWVLG